MGEILGKWATSMSVLLRADFAAILEAVGRLGGADLVLTSPPYDDARTYGADVSWELGDYQRLGEAIFAALKPGGHAVVVVDGPVRERRPGVGSERSLTPFRVATDWSDRIGFRFVERLAYARAGNVGEYRGRFRNDWEPLLWFQRPGASGFFDKRVLEEPAKYDIREKRWNDWQPDGSKRVRRMTGRAAREGVRNRGTLWDYMAVREQNPFRHPARFSTALAEDAVRCFAPPGGLVVDPMVGSGTTAVAAVRHGRSFAGSDAGLDPEGRPWALVAHERVVGELSTD